MIASARNSARLTAMASAALSLLLWTAPIRAQTPTADITPIVNYAGPDRTDHLLAEARKEGSLLLYTSATVEDMKTQIDTFEKKYGVKVNLWRGDSEGIAQRAITEHRGAHDVFDVAETSGINLESMHREGLLQPVNALSQADIFPPGIPAHREFTASRLQIHANSYNTNAVKKTDLPKTWDDLTNPRWKGKLGMEADDGDWFGTVVNLLGEQKGLDVFRRIAAANGMSLRKGHTLLANLTVSGEVPLSISIYEYKIQQMKKAGAPIDYFYLDPVIVHPVGMGISKRAPHPNAAALFFDFILTEGQKIYLEQQSYPSNVKIKPLPQGVELHVIDFARALDEQDKWSKIYKDTFLARPR